MFDAILTSLDREMRVHRGKWSVATERTGPHRPQYLMQLHCSDSLASACAKSFAKARIRPPKLDNGAVIKILSFTMVIFSLLLE